MSVHKHRLVAEICHPSKPFCPWAKRPASGEPAPGAKPQFALHMHSNPSMPMSEGVTYVGYDVSSLPSRCMAHKDVHDVSIPLLRPGKSGIIVYEDGKEITLPLLKAGTVSEFYLSTITANPYLLHWVAPALVHEARRILERDGKLVFFNGYTKASGSVTVDFGTGHAGTLGRGPSYVPSFQSEMATLLKQFFRPLNLEEHTAFFSGRAISRATELEPGVNVSVFVRAP